MKNRKRIIIFFSVIAVMWIAHTFSKNFITDPTFASFLVRKEIEITNISLWTWMIQIHIALALVALITGPFGLSKKIRAQNQQSIVGTAEFNVLSIVLNFIPGIYVSFFANGGVLSTIGFIILNSLWLLTTILGYLAIRKRKMTLHRNWMIRSFLLTFANMTIYTVLLLVHFILGFDYGTSYTIAVWLSFSVNLGAAEWLSRKTKL